MARCTLGLRDPVRVVVDQPRVATVGACSSGCGTGGGWRSRLAVATAFGGCSPDRTSCRSCRADRAARRLAWRCGTSAAGPVAAGVLVSPWRGWWRSCPAWTDVRRLERHEDGADPGDVPLPPALEVMRDPELRRVYERAPRHAVVPGGGWALAGSRSAIQEFVAAYVPARTWWRGASRTGVVGYRLLFADPAAYCGTLATRACPARWAAARTPVTPNRSRCCRCPCSGRVPAAARRAADARHRARAGTVAVAATGAYRRRTWLVADVGAGSSCAACAASCPAS